MLRNFTIDASGDMSGSLNGTAVSVDKAFDGFAIQAVISAASSPVGTLKVQASLDSGTPANWADVPDTSTAISAAGTVVWNFAQSHYKWVRTVYTRTSGSATLTTTFNENR